MRETLLLADGFNRLREVLEESGGFELETVAPASGADAVWVVKGAGDEVRLLVECKATIWPRDVEGVASQFRSYRALEAADRCLLVAPSLTRRTRELLRRYGIDYVDLGGELRVTVPGRLVVIFGGEGMTGAFKKTDRRDRIANPFQGKSSRIVRALLAEPARRWPVTEIAERVDVSAGLAVKTVNALEDDAYVRRGEDRSVQLADGEALLRRWAGASKNAFRRAGRFTSKSLDPDQLTAELASGFGRLGVGYAITRLAAARFIEPYAPASVVDAYIDGDPEQIAPDVGLFPVERGESVRLAVPPDAGVFQFAQQDSDVTIVNPVQLFVDLQRGGGREPDVAERLFERTLREQLAGRAGP